MMMIRNSFRYYSTRPVIEKLIETFRSSSKYSRQNELNQLIQSNEKISGNFVNEIIKYWKDENSTKHALHLFDTDRDKHLTFKDLYEETNRLANVLTGKDYNLRQGNTVLAVLPKDSLERTVLQLACLQTGLVFSSYDFEGRIPLKEINERIRKFAVDCIITDENYLEQIRNAIFQPIRPLKKGLITNLASSKALPVGWNHLLRSIYDASCEYTKEYKNISYAPALRLLIDNKLIEYSQKEFLLQIMKAACWMDTNKTPRFIWMKNQNEILSIVPWIFGSIVCYKQTKNSQELIEILQKHPIDSLCASASDYFLLNHQSKPFKTQLEQLFSSESVDLTARIRWYSLTNLSIHDDYTDLKQQKIVESTSIECKQETKSDKEQFQQTKPKFEFSKIHGDVKFYLGSKIRRRSLTNNI